MWDIEIQQEIARGVTQNIYTFVFPGVISAHHLNYSKAIMSVEKREARVSMNQAGFSKPLRN